MDEWMLWNVRVNGIESMASHVNCTWQTAASLVRIADELVILAPTTSFVSMNVGVDHLPMTNAWILHTVHRTLMRIRMAVNMDPALEREHRYVE